MTRGTATRYQRSHLLRLLAIQRLRREGVPTLAAIKQRIDAAGEAALLEAVRAQPPSASVAAALGLPAPEANGGGQGLGAARAGATSDGAGLIGEAWRRVPLLPGLELLLAEDASPAVRQVAEQIRAYCGKR